MERKARQHIFKIIGILSMIVVFVTAVIAVIKVANNPKKNEEGESNLSSISALDSYIPKLIDESNQINSSWLRYETNDDGTLTWAGFVQSFTAGGVTTTLDNAMATNKAIMMENFSKSIVIPSEVEVEPGVFEKVTAVNIDCTATNYQYQQVIAEYITAIVLPKTINEITQASFWGFGALEYFETPFVGTHRGSSALGANDEDKTSMPLVRMFSYSSAEGGSRGTSYVGELATWTEDAAGNRITPTDAGTITSQTCIWYESMDRNDGRDFYVPGNLKKVKVTDDTSLGNRAMFNINSLQDIEITADYDVISQTGFSIGYYCFSQSLNLLRVTLPKIYVSIGKELFSNCPVLEKVELPANLLSIPEGTFYLCGNLKEVAIPTSVTEIGDSAFSGCSLLANIQLFNGIKLGESGGYEDGSQAILESTKTGYNLPSKLERIGSSAFKDNQLMTKISVPNTVVSIGNAAFAGCYGIKEMTLPFVGAHRSGHIESCDNTRADYNNHSLFGYIFGTSGSTDGNYFISVSQKYAEDVAGSTYYIPTTLKSVTITDETVLEYGAFMNCTGLQTIAINDLSSMQANSMIFDEPTKSILKEISIPYMPNSRLANLFGGNAANLPETLETIRINRQEYIAEGTFHNCTKIKNVYISDYTQEMWTNVFYNNENLTSLTIPFIGWKRGVWDPPYPTYGWHWWWRDIEWRNAFQWIFSGTKHSATYRNDCLKYYDGYVKYIPLKLTSLTITDETAVGTYDLRDLTSLTDLTINDVSSFEESCMHGTYNLINLSVPYLGANVNPNGTNHAGGNIYTLGWFFGTSAEHYPNHTYRVSEIRNYYLPNSLTNVTLTSSRLQYLASSSFQDATSIAKVTILSPLNQIGPSIFYNCSNLSQVVWNKATFTEAAAKSFYGCKKIMDIDTVLPDTVKVIGERAFSGSSVGGAGYEIDLTDYSHVGKEAFANCLKIASIIIPSNGAVLGEGVFKDCQYLSNVDLQSKQVTKYLFQNCTNLVSIDFSDITYIPEGIFSGCTSLKYSITGQPGTGFIQDDAVEGIGAHAFEDCVSLEGFELRNTLKSIGAYAFEGCTGLYNMTIPSGCTTIAEHGWDNCNSNFHFYVYHLEENWPSSWVDNWNCYWPVYIIGHVDDSIFTYVYEPELKGYRITGLVDGASLVGSVKIPRTHNGLKIVAIGNVADHNNPLSAQTQLDTVILPNTIQRIEPGTFKISVKDTYGNATASRVDVYLEHTKAQVNALNALGNAYVGWTIGESEASWIEAGLVYYQDYWQYGTGTSSEIPYVKLSTVEFTPYLERSTYTGTTIVPNEMNSIILPAVLVKNDALPNSSNWNILENEADLFTYRYSNNISVGTATFTATINSQNLDAYNTALKADGQNPVYLTGVGAGSFEIKKAIVTLYHNADSILGASDITMTYTGKPWSNNIWSSQNVKGLVSGAELVGTLSTIGSDVKYDDSYALDNNYAYDDAGNIIYLPYTDLDYIDFGDPRQFTHNLKVMRYGIDITANFEFYCYLNVTIIPKQVKLEWTGGAWEEDSKSVYLYEYTGSKMVTKAVAIDPDTKEIISDCEVSTYTADPNAILPSATIFETGAYLTQEADGNIYNDNYILLSEDDVPFNYADNAPNIIVTQTLGYHGWIGKFKIVKKNIYITINDLDYLIPYANTYWSYSTWSGPMPEGYSITGLNANTSFLGELRTDGHINQAVYTFNTADDLLKNDILWYDTFNADLNVTAPYHILKNVGTDKTPIYEDDSQNYIVNVNASVKINYHDFDVQYYIEYQVDGVTHRDLIPYQERVSSEDGEERVYLEMQYTIDGNYYKLIAVPKDSALIPNYSIDYFYNSVSQDEIPFAFQYSGTYQIGVTITGQNHNDYVKIVRLTAVKSDILLDSFDKYYDRKPVDPVNEGKILKIHSTQSIFFTYYDLDGNEIQPPSEVGTYRVHVEAEENDFFNGIDRIIEFKILPRIITIDLSTYNNGTKKYDGNQVVIQPDSADLLAAGYLLGDDDYGVADVFTGVLLSAGVAPGIYDAQSFYWRNGWAVYSTAGANNSHNYTVEIINTYEITRLEFDIAENNISTPFNYSSHKPSLIVKWDAADPKAASYDAGALNFQPVIHYSLTPFDFKNYSLNDYSTLSFTFYYPGVYKVYYHIYYDNYATVMDYLEVEIKENEIEYIDPAKLIDTNADRDYEYIVDYDGYLHEYAITVTEPLFGYTVYYSLNGTDWTEVPYSFKEIGIYQIYYKIVAPYYDTVYSIRDGSINPIDFIITDDRLPIFDSSLAVVESKTYEYDTLEHSINVNVTKPSDSDFMNILYSVDNGDTWLTYLPKFTDPGEYLYNVKIVAQNYRSYTVQATLNITPREFKNLTLTDYVAVFDNQYHTVIIGSSDGRLISEQIAKTTLDPVTGKEVTTYTTKYYYLDYMTADALEPTKVEVTFDYTGNPYVVSAGYGWDPNLAYKDVGKYMMYARVSAVGYKSWTNDNTPGYVEITVLDDQDAKLIPGQQFEYSKAPLDGNLIEVDTCHDGNKIFYYYAAYVDSDGNFAIDENPDRISAPTELGVYYIKIQYLATKNCTAIVVDGFIEIIPRTLEVKWTEEWTYDGMAHFPDAYVESGTGDIIELFVDLIGSDDDPIAAGDYEFTVSMVADNPNYKLDRDTITMKIKKIYLQIEVIDTKEYDGEIWEKNDNWNVDHLLLNNHKFVATMKTNRAIRTTYYYSTYVTDVFSNRVQVTWDIYLTDSNGELVIGADGNYISCKEYYDYDMYVEVSITNPIIDLSSFVTDTIVEYDGNPHHVEINLPAALDGARIYYIDDNGDSHINPLQYTTVGVYENAIEISKEGYETTRGTAKLIIEKAELKFKVEPLEDPNDSTDDEMAIYDGYGKTTTYSVYNHSDALVNNAPMFNATTSLDEGHIRYYHSDNIDKEDLASFYQNFDEASPIFALGQTEMVDAGIYYVVIYYTEVINKWFESYGIYELKVEQRDVDVTFNSPMNFTPTYNGFKVEFSLGDAVVDHSDLVLSHYVKSALSASSVRTISANAGYYDPKTGFEFGTIFISDGNAENERNVYKNYHPVLSDNVYVEILRAYLTSKEFNVKDSEREYDGLVAAPEIYKAEGAGDPYYYFYYYTDETNYVICNPSDFQTDVGRYYVGVYLGLGLNYWPSTAVNPDTGYAIGVLYADSTIIPKKQEINWEDTKLTFTGEKLSAKASFDDVYGTKINLDVVYSGENDEEVTGKVNAGLYQAYARFSNSTLANYLLNYELVNPVHDFEILKVKYDIYIGTEENGYEVITYGTDQRWSTVVTESMIPNLNENLSIRGIMTSDPAVLYAIDSIPGAYYGAEMFDYSYIKVYTKDTNVLVNSSIEFNVVGTLNVYANDIYFVVDNKEFVYSPNSTHGILESGALNVTFPSNNYTITYTYVNEEGETVIGTVNEPYFENVGIYTVEFTITHPDYTAKTGEVTIEIVQKEAFINFTQVLDKIYDGTAVNVSSIISTASTEFNGLPEDLVFNYYQLVEDQYGGLTYIDLGKDAPIDAGEYKVNIQCSNDIAGLLSNYTALNVDQVFKISPKKLEFNVEIDREVSQAELNSGNVFDSGIIYLYTADLPQLVGGDTLEYQIQSVDAMARNKSSHTALVYPDNNTLDSAGNIKKQTYLFSAFNKNNDEFKYTMAWDVNGTRSIDGVTTAINNSKNYYLDFTFNIFIHLPLMDIKVNGSTSDYDGNQHGITVDYGSMAGKSLTESYAFTKADLGTSSAVVKPEYIYKINPGVYPVYVLIKCDGYEPFEAEVTIAINFMSREDVQVTDVKKVYDGKPMFSNTEYTTNPYYLPHFNIVYDSTDADRNAMLKAMDNYVEANITISYYKNGSVLSIDPEKGCIAAASYTYVLTIPESDYFAEYKYNGSFIISQATIVVSDRETLYHTDYTGSLGSCSDISSNYYISLKNSDGELEALPSGLSISGTIVTSGVKTGVYGYSTQTSGTIMGSIDWFRGYCTVMQNGINVSDNYFVSLDNASITIDPVSMVYEVINEDIPYDGNYHYIVIGTTQTADGKNVYISPKVPVKYDKFEWYDESKGSWVTAYFDSSKEQWVNAYQAVNRGTYEVDVRLTATNYKQETFTVIMNIVEAETTIELAAPLDKIYDGREMGIPEIKSNNTDVDKFDYVYRYYMYVPEKDTDGIPDPSDYALMSEIIYIDSSDEWVVNDGTGDDFGNYRPVNAGKYMVEVIVGSTAADRNFNVGTECFYFIISKQVVALRWQNFTFEYDGTPKSPKANLVVDGEGDTDVPLSYTYEGRTPNASIDHINAGEYIVTASIDYMSYLEDNYELDPTTTQCSFIINQRRLTLYMNQTVQFIDGNIYTFAYNVIDGFTARNIIDNINNNGITHRVDGTLHAKDVVVPEDGTPYYLRGTAGPQSGSVFYWGQNSLGDDGFRIVDNYNVEVTKNYLVEYDITLRVDYVAVNWVAESDSVVYDTLTHGIKFQFTTASSQYRVRYYYQGTGIDLSQDFSAYVDQMPVFSEVGSYRVYFWVYRVNIYADNAIDYDYINDPANAINRQYREIIITPAPINLRLDNPNINLDKVYDSLDVVNPSVSYEGPERNVIYTYERIGQTSDYVTDNKANVGKYRLRISLGPSTSQNYAYNPADDDIVIEFEITRRELLLTTDPTSKVYDGKIWKQVLDNSYVSNSTPIVPGHEFSGTIQTLSMNAGRYDVPEMFGWYSNYRILDSEFVDVTDNYTVLTDFDVTISRAIMYADVIGYEGTYDGVAHTIQGVQFKDKDGNKLSDGPAGYTIKYSENVLDLENYPYTETPVAKTLVGIYPVYVKIEAPNYEPINEVTSIVIRGLSFKDDDDDDDPDDDELDSIDENLKFKDDFEYCGLPYPTPSYTCPSTGKQTVTYYNYDDTDLLNPLSSAPINAGYYKFVIDIDTDGIYEKTQIGPQTIRIYPAKVQAIWDNLTQTYDGEELVPTAKFVNIDGTDTPLDVIEPHINSGSYTVTAKLTDHAATNVLASNYVINVDETATFVIEKKKVTQPNILENLSTQYSYELDIFDSSDNQYYVDANGVVTKIVASDGTETLNPELDYTIKLDLNKDADRTIGVTNHIMKLVLTDTNFEWDVLAHSNPIEIAYNINPLQIPNDELDLRYEYTYQWVFDGVTAIEPTVTIKAVLKNAASIITPELVAEAEEGAEPLADGSSTEGSGEETVTPAYVPKTSLIVLPATEITLNQLDALGTGDFEITGYENNDRVSTNGNLAKINIEGRNNFEFTVSKDFQILAETPKLLTLKDGVIPQFIVANYDGELVEFLEDGNAPTRTIDNKTNPYYLAHIAAETLVYKVLDCFATNENTTIRVYKSRVDAESGDFSLALTADQSNYSFITTGYTFVLYDENDLALDKITTVIFGDTDGSGTIDPLDISNVKDIINDNLTFDDLGGYEYYLAGIIDRTSKNNVNPISISYIKDYINNISNFNADYVIE